MSVQLRPLSLGEMLDHTFNLYRRNFALFFGVSMLPALLTLFVGLSADIIMSSLGKNLPGTPSAGAGGMPNFDFATILYLVVFGLSGYLAYFLGAAISQAAGIRALSSVYLGRSITITEAFSGVREIFGRVLGTIFLGAFLVGGPLLIPGGVGLAAYLLRNSLSSVVMALLIGLTFLLATAGFVFLVYLGLRYAIAVPACVIENRGIEQSLKRSAFLMQGNYGNVWLILFLVGLIAAGIALVFQVPLQIVATLAIRHSPWMSNIINQLAQFAGSALASPFRIIAISLVYYDARIRKEAFDIEFLMRESGIAGNETQTSAATTLG